MQKTKKKEQKLLTEKLLQRKATLEEKSRLAKTEAVEKRMLKQWQQAEETDKEEREARIWNNIQQSLQKPIRRINYRMFGSLAAACITLLIVIGGLWLTEKQHTNKQEVYNEIYADTHRMLMLPDSSKIWLQPGTSVRYARNFMDKRKVWLKGDAVFEVAHQSGKPFLVYLNEAFVEVKGTVFRVNTHSVTHNEVVLFSGRVDLHTQRIRRVIHMTPNQQAIIANNNTVSVKDISCIKWENGRYVFHEMELASLIHAVNELYNIKIVLAKNVSNRSLFNGSIYYDDEPSVIIKKICYNLNLEQRSNGEVITIYKP